MGQFRIQEQDNLASKIQALKNQWLTMKEFQPLGLDKSVMYYYESPQIFNSQRTNLGAGGIAQTDIIVRAKFVPDSGKLCFIIPEIKTIPGNIKPTIFGGLKTIKTDGSGNIYFETLYTVIMTDLSDFKAQFTVYSSAPGKFTVWEDRS